MFSVLKRPKTFQYEIIGTLILQRYEQCSCCWKDQKLFNMNFESDVFVHLTVIVCEHKIENIVKVSTWLAIIANIWQKNVKFSKICEISWFSFDLYLNQPLPGSWIQISVTKQNLPLFKNIVNISRILFCEHYHLAILVISWRWLFKCTFAWFYKGQIV